ncbi:hypothetical protein EKO04_001176 [Ascochyta lentis]|uniref:Uncharacterized protein n=1 Tax=Ascochyta lentis TaxID=205686 RepID=A0A8H7JCA4_9PLEO|nr:hypothetical protein EKO04_001176 [Ascochyta lentis]
MNSEIPGCEMGSPVRKNDAVTFIAQVKERFAEEPERYNRFLKAFTEIYGSSAPNVPYETRMETIRAEMRDNVFKDNKDLLQGFESFIPSQQQETSTSQEQKVNEDGIRGNGLAGAMKAITTLAYVATMQSTWSRKFHQDSFHSLVIGCPQTSDRVPASCRPKGLTAAATVTTTDYVFEDVWMSIENWIHKSDWLLTGIETFAIN